MYNDLIEGLWILLSVYPPLPFYLPSKFNTPHPQSLDDLEPLTSKSGRPLDIKVWSSQRALVKIFKGRLDAKMKLWPRPKGNKEETVGVKLLQMLLSEVERRGVIANQLASLVVWHFEAEQQQQHAQENEDLEENGDEVEVVEGDFSEMAV
jgi:hypothetical protein